MVGCDTFNFAWFPNELPYRLLDGLNLAFTVHAVYHYLVLNFGRYDQLDGIVWSFKVGFYNYPTP